jgi:hypothetical protein
MMVRLYSVCNDPNGGVESFQYEDIVKTPKFRFTKAKQQSSFTTNKNRGTSMNGINQPSFTRFIHWITERHNIYLRRLAGQEKPWTTDKVLQQYFFTNPYREHDKVTVWFRENIRGPLCVDEDPATLPWATVAFRWFNYIPTGKALLVDGHFSSWKSDAAKRLLHARERLDMQIFTGAYMIKIENGRSKIDSCCDQITKLWDRRRAFCSDLNACKTLEAGWKIIYRIPFIGPFMAYEVITDLRHTPMFNKAPDIMTWCNLGPGAIRGLWRLFHNDDNPPQMKGKSPPKNAMSIMQALLAAVNEKLVEKNLNAPPNSSHSDRYPLFEMRDLEHSLCEYDKYCRALFHQGTMKRKYAGT